MHHDARRRAAAHVAIPGSDGPSTYGVRSAPWRSWRAPGRPLLTAHHGFGDNADYIIAKCTVAGEDMGAWMVSRGWALAYRRYSLDYVDEEAGARAARRGIWASDFVKPWECVGASGWTREIKALSGPGRAFLHASSESSTKGKDDGLALSVSGA